MEMNKVIVGQKHMVERLLIGLLGQGHILLEGVPGLAKTLAINAITSNSWLFSRINLHQIYCLQMLWWYDDLQHKSKCFLIKKGPILLTLY
jgi:MoxR-like ATPase